MKGMLLFSAEELPLELCLSVVSASVVLQALVCVWRCIYSVIPCDFSLLGLVRLFVETLLERFANFPILHLLANFPIYC